MEDIAAQHRQMVASLKPNICNALKHHEHVGVAWSRHTERKFRNRHALRGRAEARTNTVKDHGNYYDSMNLRQPTPMSSDERWTYRIHGE